VFTGGPFLWQKFEIGNREFRNLEFQNRTNSSAQSRKQKAQNGPWGPVTLQWVHMDGSAQEIVLQLGGENDERMRYRIGRFW
jgi:hypothetical protein